MPHFRLLYSTDIGVVLYIFSCKLECKLKVIPGQQWYWSLLRLPVSKVVVSLLIITVRRIITDNKNMLKKHLQNKPKIQDIVPLPGPLHVINSLLI